MIYFIICSGVITAFAIVLCMFSGRQQRKEDAYLSTQRKNASREEMEKARQEQADWDLLNKWEDDT